MPKDEPSKFEYILIIMLKSKKLLIFFYLVLIFACKEVNLIQINLGVQTIPLLEFLALSAFPHWLLLFEMLHIIELKLKVICCIKTKHQHLLLAQCWPMVFLSIRNLNLTKDL